VGYAYLLWKKKKSCLKRKRARKQTEDEGKLRAIRKEDYRSKVGKNPADDLFLFVILLFKLLNHHDHVSTIVKTEFLILG
jgi:hypothetical protein